MHLSFIRFSVITVLAVMLSRSIILTQSLSYPPTRRTEQTDIYHGIRVADPYRWLEEMDSAETQAWARAQDDLTTTYLSGVQGREALRRRLTLFSDYELESAPVKAGRRYFFTRSDAGGSQAKLLVQESLTAAPRLLFDPARMPDSGDMNLRAFWPDNEGRQIALALAKGQSRWREIRVMTSADKLQADSLRGLHATSMSLVWTRDGRGFYYVRFDAPQPDDELKAGVRNQRICFHRPGTKQAADEVVYADADPDAVLSVQLSDEGRYLMITARSGTSAGNRILYLDLHNRKGGPVALFPDDAAYTFLGNRGSRAYFYTSLAAPRGRIITVDLHDRRARISNIVPETHASMAAGSLVGGNALGMFGNRLVVMYWVAGQAVLKVFDLRGRLRQTIKLPTGSSVWGGLTGRSDDSEIFYGLLTFDSPRTIWRLELKTGRASVFRRAAVPFRSGEYVVSQVFYRSSDGTRVPMFLAHRKGMRPDGTAPVMMYAYGAFGWNSFLWYQPQVLAWLERGGIYALPRIRGGGEYGEAWHQAGMKLREQNSIADYIAAAEWLIRQRYTTAAKLVANGGSASSATAAAAVMQRPDLFGAALIDIPVLDMLRYDKFTAGHQWSQEFGSTNDATEFRALYSYSPYHNLKKGTCYPPTLIRTGEKDSTAVPAHGYKFTAAMQSAQGCKQPVLLKVMWGAGHNFGATPEQIIANRTDELLFLQRALRLPEAHDQK